MQLSDKQIKRFNENKVSGKKKVIIREILLRSVAKRQNMSMKRKDIYIKWILGYGEKPSNMRRQRINSV